MMMALWLITAFFVISNVLGELTSTSVTEQPVRKYVDTIDDMRERNMSWVETYYMDGMLERNLPEQHDNSKTMNAIEGLRYVLEHPEKYIYYSPKEAAIGPIRSNFWNGRGDSPFHISPPIDGEEPRLVTGFLRKGSPYTETITRKTLDMLAAGLYRGKFIPDTNMIFAQEGQRFINDTSVEEEEITVSLESLSLYLYTCLGMLVFAVVVFLIELCAPTAIIVVQALNELRHLIFWR